MKKKFVVYGISSYTFTDLEGDYEEVGIRRRGNLFMEIERFNSLEEAENFLSIPSNTKNYWITEFSIKEIYLKY